MEFFATCPGGFERLLGEELEGLGIRHVRPLRGQVSFGGPLESAYRVCLWSRLASRVILVLTRGGARNADELYDTVASVAWEDQLLPHATLAIDAHGTNDELRNSRFVGQRAKDAITDRLMARRGARPVTDPAHPDLTVSCRISHDHVTVGIDLAGEALFRRGYEDARGPIAPLRPDYAAALLAAGGTNCRGERPATLCLWSGAGTVAVEAAEQALDRAPGLLRPRWGFEGWAGHESAAWEGLLDEADERAEAAAGRKVTIVTVDERSGAEAALKRCLRSAGLAVEPTYLSWDQLGRELPSVGQSALVACDLSWVACDNVAGEAAALSRLREAAPLLEHADALAALTRTTSLDKALGTSAKDVTEVFLGRDRASIRTYNPSEVSASPAHVRLKDGMEIPVLVEGSEQFARRLEKVARLRARWARRELVSCYRVYDSDLPDYAVSIDLYAEAAGPGRWLYVSEYAAPRGIDPELAHERLMDVLTIAPHVLGVDPKDVFLRVRSHGRGGSQYAPERDGRRDAQPRSLELPPGAHLIEEGGLTFEVNFSGRLDCGIFLDHRETRTMIRELAKDMHGSKRFLNLFAYTGTATCYAADGGALHTTTVDMSLPSLEWAWRNMERNGFTGAAHEYIQADVLEWTREQRHSPNRWDLIFCDVPTFSNSSRMRHGSWDVQRDHVELLITLSRLLIRGGTCVFSCNLRSFKPDVEALAKAGVEIEDITERTIPEDFKRNPKIHHCYLVRRTA